jgi:FkbM family methyltransferase
MDIGANIGVYAVYLTALPGLTRADCFEPAPEAFAELERNVALQPDPSRIRAHALALSDRTGRARLATWGPMAGNNMLTDDMARDKKPREVLEVARATLDETVDLGGATFVAKIDVEGHEMAVIAGGRETFGANRGLVQIESFDERAPALRDAMAKLGHVWLGRMKDDHFFTNLEGDGLRDALREILWEETAAELHRLKELRALRRRLVKLARRTLDEVKYGTDPLSPKGEDGNTEE